MNVKMNTPDGTAYKPTEEDIAYMKEQNQRLEEQARLQDERTAELYKRGFALLDQLTKEKEEQRERAATRGEWIEEMNDLERHKLVLEISKLELEVRVLKKQLELPE